MIQYKVWKFAHLLLLIPLMSVYTLDYSSHDSLLDWKRQHFDQHDKRYTYRNFIGYILFIIRAIHDKTQYIIKIEYIISALNYNEVIVIPQSVSKIYPKKIKTLNYLL